MAKLKDIFPKWLLKERAFGNLEVGSAFAHLAEDDDRQYLHTDYPLIFGSAEAEAEWNANGTGVVTYIDPGSIHIQPSPGGTSAFSVRQDGDTQVRLRIAADGSLDWGNGVDAPATKLKWEGGSVYLDGADYPALRVRDPEGLIASFDTYDLQFMKDSVSQPSFRITHMGVIGWGDGVAGTDVRLGRVGPGLVGIVEQGGGLQLKSPDGTAYNVHIANGGAITVTPA